MMWSFKAFGKIRKIWQSLLRVGGYRFPVQKWVTAPSSSRDDRGLRLSVRLRSTVFDLWIFEVVDAVRPSVAFKASSLMVMPLLFSRSDQTVFVGLARNKARRETLTSQHSREIDRLEATAAIVRFNQPPVVPLYCWKKGISYLRHDVVY